jgi:hypothetical protein
MPTAHSGSSLSSSNANDGASPVRDSNGASNGAGRSEGDRTSATSEEAFTTPAETPKVDVEAVRAAEADERSLDTSAFVTGSSAADLPPTQQPDELSDEAVEYILTEPLRTPVGTFLEEVEEDPTPRASPVSGNLGGEDSEAPGQYVEEYEEDAEEEDAEGEAEEFQVLTDRGAAAQHRTVRVKNRSIEGDMLPDFNEVYDDVEEHAATAAVATGSGAVTMSVNLGEEASDGDAVEATLEPPYSYPPSGKDVAFI